MNGSKLSNPETPRSQKVEYILTPFKPVRKATSANLTRTDLGFCDDPPPKIVFEGRSFCLTGIFAFENGDRHKCENAVHVRGGICVQRPGHNLNYLIIGTFVEPAWAHKGYGRKIETAVELKQFGSKCKIVCEAQWVKALQIFPELPKEKQTSPSERSRNSQIGHLQRALYEMERNHLAILRILQRELKMSDYKRIVKLFQKSGIVTQIPSGNPRKVSPRSAAR